MKRRTRRGGSQIGGPPKSQGFILARVGPGEFRAIPFEHFISCFSASGRPPGEVLRVLLGLGPRDTLSGVEVFLTEKPS